MKKLIFLFILMFFIKTSFAQTDSIKVTPAGLTEVKIKTDIASNLIYQRTLTWVNEIYKNPEKVLTGKIVDQSITISGYSGNAYEFNSLGIIFFYDISYHLYITIDNDVINYKMVIDDVSSQGTSASAERSIYLSFFKKTGELRPMYKRSKVSLERTINKLLFSYYEKLKSSEMSSDEAITLLKKYKDKLDLQLITQEEYNKQKQELSKYIK